MSLNNFKDKKILITGGAGFVGANLVRRLIKEKARLHLLIKPETKLWRLKGVEKNCQWHQVSLTEKNKLNKLVTKIQPKIIFHLAAHGAYPAQNRTDKIINSNVFGTLNLLEATKDLNYQSFINTGSSSEYGWKKKPMKETDILEPNSIYAVSKAAASWMCKVFAQKNDKPMVTLRLFSVYGEYEEPSRLVPTAIRACLKGDKINLASGEQRRDFVYIDDVIEAYLLAAKNSNLRGEMVNIGSGIQYSVNDVVSKIIEVTGKKVRVEKNSYQPRSWDSDYWVANRRLAKKILRWEPEYNLDQGLEKTIKWFLTK